MSSPCEVTTPSTAAAPMSFFERYLTAWVALCIVIGIALGQGMPGVFKAIGAMEIAKVNLPVGLLIWVMIIPMLLKIDFAALHQVKEHVRGIGVTLVINWLVKPFSMAFLGWLFIRVLFADWLPAEQLDSYVAGLILLAAAPSPLTPRTMLPTLATSPTIPARTRASRTASSPPTRSLASVPDRPLAMIRPVSFAAVPNCCSVGIFAKSC